MPLQQLTLKYKKKRKPMLAIKNLHAGVDDKNILKGINLEVNPGEIHAIMGPNGAGKSTFASIIAGKEGSCCHNAKLLRADDESPYVPVIYDFDSSGYVDAPYAITPAKLELRNVRQRIYRGFCTDPEVLDGILDEFRNKRESLLAVAAETDQVGKRSARKGVSYLKDFYSVIENPKRLKKKIIEVCR